MSVNYILYHLYGGAWILTVLNNDTCKGKIVIFGILGKIKCNGTCEEETVVELILHYG
jgi:hypothetical protein